MSTNTIAPSVSHATSLPSAPRLSSVRAVNHYLTHNRVKFSLGGSNLATQAQAFFLSQASFRADHDIVLA